MLQILLFIVGFALLVKGADWLVEGASSIAKKFNVSSLVIGLTVVAFGTSAPEFFVTLIAQLKDSSDIAIGNILGSNIANVLFILGTTALFLPLKLQKSTVWKEIPFGLLAAIVLFIMLNRSFLDNTSQESLNRSDGLILLSFFLIFLSYAYETARNQSAEEDLPEFPLLKSILFTILGIAVLALGGQWVVNGAIYLADLLHMSQSFIGLTIVALGTSLPEFATSLTAAVKKRVNIAVGNVVGSNIFNIFFVLGITATLKPYQIVSPIQIDLWMGIIVMLLLFLFVYLSSHHTLRRSHGILFLVLYSLYLVLTYSMKQASY